MVFMKTGENKNVRLGQYFREGSLWIVYYRSMGVCKIFDEEI